MSPSASVLLGIGIGCSLVALVHLFRESSQRTADGWMALANASFAMSVIVNGGSLLSASVNTACAVWGAHSWWNGGGGDDTKRQLRRLGRAFTPVRRTAPTA